MPMPIDVRGIFEPGWTNAGTSTEPDEPIKTRLAILQSLEHEMALAQGRAEKEIQLYEEPLERHPSLDISMNPNADKTIYVNSLFLGKSYPDMEYRIATMLITEQLRPENWTQLSPDAKIETISLLEQTMAIQQTRNAEDSSGADTAPPVSRPVRSISAEEGADKPLCLLSDTGLVIGKDKLADDTAGLDILDAMVCAQLDYKKWNNSPLESKLSTLQLAEYGMAARQGRFPRLIIQEKNMPKEEYGSYNPNTPDILKISLKKLKSSVNEDLTHPPLKDRTILDFPNFELLDTVIHEGRHAAQDDVIHGILKPETLGITPELAEQWKQNYEAYLTSKRYTYSAYRFQAIEADANDTAYKRTCQDFSGMLGESPVYLEYLTLKRNDRQLQEQSAKSMFGEKYLDEIGEIVAQEHDAKTRKEVQPIDLKPGSDLNNLLIQFGERWKSPYSSPLMNKSSAVSLLEEALLTEAERQLKESEKEKSIHSKLSQLYFGETSFPQLLQRTRNIRKLEGYDIIYAAAFLTEAMEGRRLVSDGDAMPGPASLKIGSNFVPVLRPVPTVPKVKPKRSEPVTKRRPQAPMGGQTQTQSRTRPGALSDGSSHLPVLNPSLGQRPTDLMGRQPQSRTRPGAPSDGSSHLPPPQAKADRSNGKKTIRISNF